MVDAVRFPSLARFLSTLPSGLEAYPDCLAKASMYRNLADDSPMPSDDTALLPCALRRLLEDPVPVSSWIPEVHSHAVMLAIYDRCFPDLAAFGRFTYRQGKALLEGRLYSIAFKLVPPSLLVKTATMRWSMFHRGADLSATSDGPGRARARIDHPPGLFEQVVLRGFCEGIRAALDLATRGGSVIEVTDTGPEHAALLLRWNDR